MTDFSSYFLNVCSANKNLPYYQKSQVFVFEQNSKSVSFKNKTIIITRSALSSGILLKN